MVDHSQDQDEFRDPIARLVTSGLGGELVGLEPIAPGLGTRRFFRVHLTGGRVPVSTAIARIELPEDSAGRPQGVAPEPPLEPLRNFLEQAGLPVPKSYARDGAIQLLEDAGPLSLEDAAGQLAGDECRDLYAEACRLVPRLQRLSASASEIAAFGRRLDPALFAYKANLFAEWVLPLALGRAPAESEARAVRQAFAWIASECEQAPLRLSHRDFKAANLYVRPLARDTPRLLLIDLQGAFMAPPEYDLVCLLRDSHVEIPEIEVQQHLASVRPELPDAPDPATFARRFALLTLTRVGKDLARYLYAAQTRDDRRYLRLLPRAVSLLREASSTAAPWDARLGRLAELIHQLPTTFLGPLRPEEPDPACAR